MDRSQNFLILNSALLFILFVFAWNANAAVVYSHQGNNDPLLNGWSLINGVGTGVSVGAISNDIGSGLDAWFTDDNSTILGSAAQYAVTPSALEQSDAATLGWNLSTRLRVVDIPDGAFAGVAVGFGSGSTAWSMLFGSDVNGDAIVRLWDGGFSSPGLHSGPTYTASGSGYHQYQLIFDPGTTTVDLLVDGVEQISNFSGAAVASTVLLWGASSSGDTGQGNFNSVQFSIGTVPVPPAIWLFGSGLLGLAGMARRKKA